MRRRARRLLSAIAAFKNRVACLVLGHVEDRHSLDVGVGGTYELMRVSSLTDVGYHLNPCKRCRVMFMVPEPPLPMHQNCRCIDDDVCRHDVFTLLVRAYEEEHRLRGHQSVGSIAARLKFEECWHYPCRKHRTELELLDAEYGLGGEA